MCPLFRSGLGGDSGSLSALCRSDAPRIACGGFCARWRSRSHLGKRVAIVAPDRAGLVQRFSAVADSGQWQEHVSASAENGLRTAFVCTGMGPQWWGMGRQLLETNAVYQRAIEACDTIFGAISGWSLREELLKSAADSRVASTEVAQPLNFALQYALAQLMADCGIQPQVIVGHSVGEVAAAALSGALSLEDALLVSYHRSRLQQRTAHGMLAVGMSEAAALECIAAYPRVSIAALNAPTAVTVAGAGAELDALATELEQRSIFNRRLKVEIAYHSAFMDELQPSVLDALAGIRPQVPKIPLFSTVTGAELSGELMDAEYWWRNIRQPVRFMPAIEEVLRSGCNRFIEVGPHPALSGAIRECLSASNASARVYGTLNRKSPDESALMDCLAQLHCGGLEVNWRRLLPAGSFVRIPHYPWQYQALRNETQRTREYLSGRGKHPFLNEDLCAVNPGFQVDLNPNFFPWLQDHRIRDNVLFPGAGFIECGLAICREVEEMESYSIEKIRFQRFLEWNADSLKRLHTSYDPHTGKIGIFSQLSSDASGWIQHAAARALAMPVEARPDAIDVDACFERLDQRVCVQDYYAQLDSMGLQYGETFRRIEALAHDDRSFIAKLRSIDDTRYSIHPAVLDAAFQAVFAPLLEAGRAGAPALPVGVERMDLWRPGQSVRAVWGEILERTPSRITANLVLYDAQGSPVACLHGATFQEFSDTGTNEGDVSGMLHALNWVAAPKPVLPQSTEAARWLLVGDLTDTATELTELLVSQGIVVDWVCRNSFMVEESITSFDIYARLGGVSEMCVPIPGRFSG